MPREGTKTQSEIGISSCKDIEIRNAPGGDENKNHGADKEIYQIEIRNAPGGDENKEYILL